MKDINDMERFYDPCDDTRTQTQIIWEEGIYREGSFRQKWAYNFGKNGFYKFGKKIVAFFTVMIFWIALDSLIPYNGIKIILQALEVAVVNLGSVWLYRQTGTNKEFTRLNIIYVVGCGIFTLIFYKYMDFVFGYMSYGIFLSLYYVTYVISKNISVIVRLVVSVVLIYTSIRYNITKNKEYILSVIFCIISTITGICYRCFAAGNSVIYNISLFIVMISVVFGFLLYIITGNKFLRNVTMLFAFVSLMEILGSNAVATGAMERYINDGVLY